MPQGIAAFFDSRECSMDAVFSMCRMIRCSRLALLPVLLPVLLTVMCGCSSAGTGSMTSGSASNAPNPADRLLACKRTDRLIASPAQCLQDDAACYEITGGQWCTGPRGSVCPEGSVELASGTECPNGVRCFNVSESLECRI